MSQKPAKNKSWPTISRRTMLILLTIFGLGGGLLFGLAYAGIDGQAGIGQSNQAILDWIISLRTAWLSDIAWLVAVVLGPEVMTAVSIITGLGWMIWRREVWRPLLLLIGTGLAGTFSLLIKDFTANPRPDIISQLPPLEETMSFPSGHVAMLVSYTIILSYLLISRAKLKTSTLVGLLIANLIMALVMAFDRLYLAVHWPTDVIGGLGMCFLLLAFVIGLDLLFRRTRHSVSN